MAGELDERQFIEAFKQDFLDESAEHLQTIMHDLLALEKQTGAAQQIGLLNELFRAFHTLKGLCGMVELEVGVSLSHALESVLRALKDGNLHITTPIIDELIHGTRILEGVIATMHEPSAEMPAVNEMVKRLEHIVPLRTGSVALAENSSPAANNTPTPEPLTVTSLASDMTLPDDVLYMLNAADKKKLQTAFAEQKFVALGIFTPTEQIAAKGVNVNAIRERLAASTELIKSLPLIKETRIRFAFLVATESPLQPDEYAELEWMPMSRLDSEKRPTVEPMNPPNPTPTRAPVAEPTPAWLREGPLPAEPPNSAADELTQAPVPVTEGALGQAMRATSTSIRVDISRLDEVIRLVGALVVNRARLKETLPRLKGAPAPALEALTEITGQFERQLRDLREAVMRVRLVPLAEVFGRMPLAVRDLARQSGREVRLVMEGQETEIDKNLGERIFDPLMHMVRNSITHGFETPQERVRNGKPREGTLTLAGRPEGDHIVITVGDDGAGVNLEKIAARARMLGLLGEDETLEPESALEILCKPGFTTETDVNTGAGRGVGMDVVQKAVDAVGGSLTMHTVLGKGTTFALRLPLTLAIIDAFIVAAGDERYAVPQSAVNEAIEIDPARLTRTHRGELFPYRTGSLPLVRISKLFGLEHDGSNTGYGLVVGDGNGRSAIVVDELLGLREVVVHTLSDPLVTQPGVAGATELGDGTLALILDVPELLRFSKQRNG